MLAAVLPTFAAGNRGDLPFPSRPTLAIGRTERPPVVDGGLEDPAWSNAACIPVLQDWRTGRPLSPGTRVYACWDSAALYVAWDCREPDVRNIVARTKGDVWQDDDVELFLQRPGRPDYRHLMVNPLGRVQCIESAGKP